ncbi:ABC transporter ATP-binding protein [Paenarthrobacter aurescens]|jgi:ABC-2 type transport system ATP-binding protein|uniref:ABC transporter, ATP-binding protein n=1 Tax=Paenarthrobacter aurescens (strain TC1) TaxID=290340 RepID=A1RAB7_PAEAT|nr:ATP-binding cassette domain-containing protein [Paenarthrobacter aurescens]ABM08323.1 putative ABC transporter, ATP-binding protein [Paenarthrobacter aurescens TC1]
MTIHASFEAFSKRRGSRFAVEELTFDVAAGRVVGLIGPNGAGKSTALAGLTGLLEATSGRATVFGTDYRSLRRPATKVGVNLDGMDVEPGLTGRRHLKICQLAVGADPGNVERILELVDLAAEGNKKVRDYSLGMRQRLGIASALVGSPEMLVLDEPANGLDPEGVQWLRRFLRDFAASGGSALVSSHQLMELEQVADEVVILKQRVLFRGTIEEAKALGAGSLESAYFKILEGAR